MSDFQKNIEAQLRDAKLKIIAEAAKVVQNNLANIVEVSVAVITDPKSSDKDLLDTKSVILEDCVKELKDLAFLATQALETTKCE